MANGIMRLVAAFGLVAAIDYQDGRMDVVQGGIDTVKNLGEETYTAGQKLLSWVSSPF